MPNDRRNRQVANTIREEIVTIARKDLNDPGLARLGAGMITFSSVDLTDDMRNATVWVAFMGKPEGDKDVKLALKALENSAAYIHRLLIKRIPIKVHPLLTFKYDNGFDRAKVVNEALHEAAGIEKETARVREEYPEDEAAAKARYRQKKGLPEQE